MFSHPNNEYKEITCAEAMQSPAYANVMANLFKQRLALALQGFYRNRDTYKAPEKSYDRKDYIPLEPISERFKYIAKLINAGEWFELDFYESDFKAHVLKALRHNLINTYQLATAFNLADAIDFFNIDGFGCQVRKYDLADKSKFDFDLFHCVSNEVVDKFYQSIDQLDVSDRFYFSFELTEEHILALLVVAIRDQRIDMDKDGMWSLLFNALLNYLNENKFTTTLLTVEKLNYLMKNDKEKYFIKEFLNKKISMIPNVSVNNFKNLMETWGFFINISRLNFNIPAFYLKFTENDDELKIKFIVLTVAANQLLLSCLNGKEVTWPDFMLGIFDRATILDNFLDSEYESRPIELFMPGIIAGEAPHDVECKPFARSHHELYHLYRSSGFNNKKFMRHLIRNQQLVTNFYLGSVSWKIGDLEFHANSYSLEGKFYKLPEHLTKLYIVCQILDRIYPKFFSNIESDDNHYIILVDMIINREIWHDFCDQYPDEFFISKMDEQGYWIDDNQRVLVSKNFIPVFQYLSKVNEKLAKITQDLVFPDASIHDVSRSRTNDAVTQAILLDRMNTHGDYNPTAIEASSELRQQNFEDHLRWTRNSGLITSNKKLISKMSNYGLNQFLVTSQSKTNKSFAKPIDQQAVTNTQQPQPFAKDIPEGLRQFLFKRKRMLAAKESIDTKSQIRNSKAV